MVPFMKGEKIHHFFLGFFIGTQTGRCWQIYPNVKLDASFLFSSRVQRPQISYVYIVFVGKCLLISPGFSSWEPLKKLRSLIIGSGSGQTEYKDFYRFLMIVLAWCGRMEQKVHWKNLDSMQQSTRWWFQSKYFWNFHPETWGRWFPVWRACLSTGVGSTTN